MIGPDSLTHRIRPARGEAEGALVLLHGRGADEHDLLPLADALDPDRRLHVLTPRAPITGPEGGAHWYALAGLPTPDPETFQATWPILTGWLDALPEAIGVPWERTVLGGFSQGAVMSYAAGLGAGRPSPAGILTLSGYIPEVPGLELALDERAGLPVMIGHGSLDRIIPVRFGQEAAARLGGADLEVTFRESPVAHGIDPGALPELRDWVGSAMGLLGFQPSKAS
ncbi:MAG: phospholipase [Solirubrobacterales bacterium]|nr:phospholipase [Solirubrobacterales bacterium]